MVNMPLARRDGLCFIETALLSWHQNYGIQEAAQKFNVLVAASMHNCGRAICTFMMESLTVTFCCCHDL